MMWRNSNGNIRCPRCGGLMDLIIEREDSESNRRVRHVLRCKYCGYRLVLQEVVIRKAPQGVITVNRIT